MTQPVAALTVIYARDIERVARFYARTLSLTLQEEDDGFIVLGNGRVEVAVVRMAGEAGPETSPGSFDVRTEASVKSSFLVDSLEEAGASAEASGGSMKPLSSAWRWRDQLHLDGHDPEGNVVQLRMSAA